MTECVLCGDAVYNVSVHPCCEFWADTIRRTGACPACAESRRASLRRVIRRRRHKTGDNT